MLCRDSGVGDYGDHGCDTPGMGAVQTSQQKKQRKAKDGRGPIDNRMQPINQQE